jgi:cytochrome c oxidase cbb3-type subunit I/II
VSQPEQNTGLERLTYNDKVVRQFFWATVVWGFVGMLVGILIASELANWRVNMGIPYITFGRIRPLHTNGVIFGFACNAFFTAAYYSTQRLVKARLYSDVLSQIHFWGWQAIIVCAALTFPQGLTFGKEYGELEWPIKLAITVIWVVFAVNYFGTLLRRREKHIYVSIWFYSASIITVAALHIVESFFIPVSFLKSYSMFSGTQDALVQWWYGHNAVAFILTTPFLGMMYYFIPKAVNRPIYSYRLSIVHFWSLIFVYIWAGPHHLHYTALPGWAQSLGMVFSIMLWMPSWGGMINGLLTLRGAWDKVRKDHVLKFLVTAVTFYGMATFEGPLMAIKSVNAISHYTDWTIGHVHSGTLGWVGFMTFGALYWLAPKLYGTKLHSDKMATTHFWLGTVGIVVYIVSMWIAGITQALMLQAVTPEGKLLYPDFVQTVAAIEPYYYMRLFGGLLYFSGVCLAVVNFWKTMRSVPTPVDETVLVPVRFVASRLTDDLDEATRQKDMTGVVNKLHHILESKPLVLTVLALLVISVGSLVELVPTFYIRDNVPLIASVKPYTPLELEGRDIYIREGCYLCHSQMVRPFKDEYLRYGPPSRPGESVYDHPFQWGSKRTGPDLARVGGKYPDLWHYRHMRNPRDISSKSIMPVFKWLLTDKLDTGLTKAKIQAMRTLGVPYSKEDVDSADVRRDRQASEIAAVLKDQGNVPDSIKDKEIVALIAYLQRLGTDIKKDATQ